MALSAISPTAGNFSLTPPTKDVSGSGPKVAEALEGMFVSVLLKTMRQSIDGEGLFPGDSSDVLGALFDQTMGDHIAQGGGLGLAQFLNSALDTQTASQSHDGSSGDDDNSPVNGK